MTNEQSIILGAAYYYKGIVRIKQANQNLISLR